MNTDETELERLRKENRRLRSLLATLRTAPPDTAEQSQSAEQERTLQTPADATGQNEHDERLRRLYETILASTPDLVYVFDRNYRFTFANHALLQMWGRTLADSVGKSLLEIGYEPWHAEMHEREIDQVIATRQSIRGEVPFIHATLGRRIYDYIFVPVLGVDGEVEAIAGTTRDVTERKRAEAALRESEERVRLATQAAGLGIWTWEPDADSVVWENAQMFAISGLSPDDPPLTSAQFLAEYVHPEDAEAFARAIAVPVQTGEPLHFVGRFYRRGGALRWVEFWGRRQPAAEGERLRVVGTAADITERKEAEQQLHTRAQEIEVLNQRLHRAMRETHHRVKNNLQVVSAMIEMQVFAHQGEGTVPVEEFVRLKAHIHTLAIVHDLLTRGIKEQEGHQRLSTKAVLERLLPMLQQTAWKQAVRYDVEEVELSSKQCAALAFILNELVTNALKHGQNRAEVFFRVEGARALLTIRDDGKGFPDGFEPAVAANTGLELVDSLVRADLHGTIAYANQPAGGGQVVVTFPLPKDDE